MNIPKTKIESVISLLANDYLRTGEYLFSIDNKCLFEIRGPSGGIGTQLVFYIINETNQFMGVRFSAYERISFNDIEGIFKAGYEKFKTSSKKILTEGSDLGLGEFIELKK